MKLAHPTKLAFLVLFPGLALGHAALAKEVTPKLIVRPSPVFDQECERSTGFKIAPEWQLELFQKLGAFQGAWDKEAGELIRASELAAGRKFDRKEYTVTLTVCKWTPMGDPFIVSVRPYLEGPARADEKVRQPMGMDAFISMTHHELLHSLVENLISAEFSGGSKILEKYRAEPLNVLVHIHLIALQKATYVLLKKESLLKETEKLYRHIGGDYKRAWEIIDREGMEQFLREMQSFNKRD